MDYKYKVGHKFARHVQNTAVKGQIIKIAAVDECGCDFHYSENNYIVKFEIDNKPMATYNIHEDNNGIIKYTYIMNEGDMDKTQAIN